MTAGPDPPIPTAGLELAARFTRPPLPALRPRDDPRRVKPVQRIVNYRLLRRALPGRRLILAGAFAFQLAHNPRASADLGRELRRELIPTPLAMLLVLGPIGLDRLADDPPRDPVIVNVCVTRRAR